MDDTEKKINQILNLSNLIVAQNLALLEVMKMFLKEDDHKTINDYMDKCFNMRDEIMSGIYEDDVNIVD